MKKILSLLLLLALVVCLPVTAQAADGFVDDGASLLTQRECSTLEAQLQALSEQYDIGIMIVTVSSIEGMTETSYPNDLIDSLIDSLRLNSEHSRGGVLLLVSMNPRRYEIIADSWCSEALDNKTIEKVLDEMYDDMKAGNYADAFATFLNQCRYYIDGHLNGFPFPFVSRLLICLGIGLVIGLFVVSKMKDQLKSVRRQSQASAYKKTGSMHLTEQSDLFLYRKLSQRPKPSSSSSGSSGSSGGGISFGGRNF